MYLNLIELAESFGVSEKVIDDWIRDEGLPHVVDRGRLLFDRVRVSNWAAVHGLTARAGFLAPEKGGFTNGLSLGPMLRTGGIWRDVAGNETLAVLERVISSLTVVPAPVRQLLAQRLRAGGINWAPVGRGFALPHFSTRVTLGREAGVIALLLLRDALPVEIASPDDTAITSLLFFIPPSPRAHLDMLAGLSRAINHGSFADLIRKRAANDQLLAALSSIETAGTPEHSRENAA